MMFFLLIKCGPFEKHPSGLIMEWIKQKMIEWIDRLLPKYKIPV